MTSRSRPAAEAFLQANAKSPWQAVQNPHGVSGYSSVAIERRSRWGLVRGNPVLSSHFSPGLAPQVGQRMANASFGSAFIAS